MELEHYKKVCDIQDRYIKGIIGKTELEQLLEIERQKFIEYLQQQNLQMQKQITCQIQFNDLLNERSRNTE